MNHPNWEPFRMKEALAKQFRFDYADHGVGHADCRHAIVKTRQIMVDDGVVGFGTLDLTG